MDLAAVGARPDGGVCRHALSDEDIAARALVIGWAEARGYEASVDEAANLFIRRPGRDGQAAPVLCGSHMDSQPAGGKFDGAYGVLAGLEALVALDDAGIETERPIDVVAFAATSQTRTIFAIAHGLDDREIMRVCFVPSNAYPTGACRRGGPFAELGFGTW